MRARMARDLTRPPPARQQAARVVATLVGHSGQVNCVKWVPAHVAPLHHAAAGSSSGGSGSSSAPTTPANRLLLSGAADHTIRVWAWLGDAGGGDSPAWTCLYVIEVSSQLPMAAQGCHLP
jgi:hypothetical protein